MLSFWSVVKAVLGGFVDLIILPYHIYQWLQLETLKEKMSALTLAGASSEFLCLLVALMLIIIGIGLFNLNFLRATVDGLEKFTSRIGRFACWFALVMMIQQVLIIAIGQIFRGNELFLSPLGINFIGSELQLQWLSGQLKLYNAILIAMASAYTFIEGGHVRVDLIYAGLKYRTRKYLDLFGTIFFLFPSSILLWWFAWPLATNSMFAQRPLNIWSDKARWRDFKWESSGTAEFSWVWVFKVMILVFAGLMLLQAFTFLLRNIQALREEHEIDTHPKPNAPTKSASRPVA
jgi:TRAP-type mannitol/chloroaromatic compound transport system permease small subunit